MHDEEVRSLERRVAAGGGARERLALAHALERVGRRDEAFDVLLPARDDLAARVALGRFPVLGGAASADGARSIDVAVPREKPDVMWERRDESDLALFAAPGGTILASPLGVVRYHQVCDGESFAAHAYPVVVLDPDTGEERWRPDAVRVVDRPEPFHVKVALAGHLLVLRRDDGLAIYDLWTGAVRGVANGLLLAAEPGTLVTIVNGSRIVVHAVTDEGKARVAWELPLAQELGMKPVSPGAVLAGDRVFVHGHARGEGLILARDRASGGALFARRGPHKLFGLRDLQPVADATLALVQRLDGEAGVEALAPDGSPLWTHEGDEDAAILTPREAVLESAERRLVLDRRTGTRLRTEKSRPRIFAREVGLDVTAAASRARTRYTVTAYDGRAKRLWRTDVLTGLGGGSAPQMALSAQPGRVYLDSARDGVTLCLASPRGRHPARGPRA